MPFVAVLDPALATSVAQLPPGERVTPYREIFLNRSVALMFVASFFFLLAGWGLSTWLPLYGTQQLELPVLLAASLTSAVWGGTLVGVLLGGVVSDRLLHTMRTPVWLLGGLGMAAAMLWAATFERGIPLWTAYLAFAIAGFCGSWSPGGQLFAPYLGEPLTPGAVGRSLGLVILGGMAGSALVQLVLPRLIQTGAGGVSYWPVFLLFAVCGVIGTLCVCGMKEPRLGRTVLGHLLSRRRPERTVVREA